VGATSRSINRLDHRLPLYLLRVWNFVSHFALLALLTGAC